MSMDWRPLITATLAQHWPDLSDGPRWVGAQLLAESEGNPRAVSPSGAQGLLQLMPATAAELGVSDPFDPAQNLAGGVRHLREQYEHLPEVPSVDERLLWAFASYNAGRGYINRAFALARLDGEPRWWTWAIGRYWLFHRLCVVAGHSPDYRQVWGYVERIQTLARSGAIPMGPDGSHAVA